MSTSHPTRVVVVGAGTIARGRHLPAFEALGWRVEVVAVVDPELDRAQALASDLPQPQAAQVFAALEPALQHTSPDLVIVCTPPVAHLDAVVTSLEAGAHVWCEKPAALSLAEVDRMAAHVLPGGPTLSFVAQHRFGSAVRRLKELMATQELGRPLVALCNTMWFRGHDYFTLPWRGRYATEGGGPTLGHGIHQIDLALSVLGDWTEVRAMMGTLDRDIEVEDVSMAAVQLASGGMLSVVNSLLSPREESYLRFDFTDATVELSHTYGYDNSNWTWTPAKHVQDEQRAASWPPALDWRSSHAAQLEHVLDCLDAGLSPSPDTADARRTLALLTAIYRSAATGEPTTPADLTPNDPFYSSLGGPLAEGARR